MSSGYYAIITHFFLDMLCHSVCFTPAVITAHLSSFHMIIFHGKLFPQATHHVWHQEMGFLITYEWMNEWMNELYYLSKFPYKVIRPRTKTIVISQQYKNSKNITRPEQKCQNHYNLPIQLIYIYLYASSNDLFSLLWNFISIYYIPWRTMPYMQT
jgi:hypothetical protein